MNDGSGACGRNGYGDDVTENGAGAEETPLVGVVFPDGTGDSFCSHCMGFCRQPVPSGGSLHPLAVPIPLCGRLVRQHAGPGA